MEASNSTRINWKAPSPVGDAKVVVAMSGGVDSSVAALLLSKQGYNCIGVSMQVWDYRNNGGCSSRATCCAPDDFTDARKVAARLGIPYYVFDFEESFRDKVINKFIDSYAKGITPNPCVDCNNKVKFLELRSRAGALGCPYVATGHYARIEDTANGMLLKRGVDRAKDQSYFLYGIPKECLPLTFFPLGSMTKPEVRELARKAGLTTADKAESQDICFVSGSVRNFLSEHGSRDISTNNSEVGLIKSRDGSVLGTHDGVSNFTVGQRRGLRVGGTKSALYVLEIEPQSQTVIVGEKSDLERHEFFIEELSWLSPEIEMAFDAGSLDWHFECICQVRSRHSGSKVRLSVASDGRARVNFLGEIATISPGQAAVFYDLTNQIVLGGGRISTYNAQIPAS